MATGGRGGQRSSTGMLVMGSSGGLERDGSLLQSDFNVCTSETQEIKQNFKLKLEIVNVVYTHGNQSSYPSRQGCSTLWIVVVAILDGESDQQNRSENVLPPTCGNHGPHWSSPVISAFLSCYDYSLRVIQSA